MRPDDWMKRANCVGMASGLFFPTDRWQEAEAKRVCEGCVVRRDCLESAFTSNGGRREQFGIWGSVNFERPREIRKRGAA